MIPFRSSRRKPGPSADSPREPRSRIWAPAFAGASGVLVAVAVLVGAAQHSSAKPQPPRPRPADGSIRVAATPVPLDPRNPAETRLGALVYAGGVELSSPDTSRLHGLSGIDVAEDGRSFVSVSDDGDLVTGRLILDAKGRLTGVAGVKLQPLRDEQGRPLQGKQQGDAEAVTLLPGGAIAVSFEREHRILSYARPGGAARRLWAPTAADRGFRLDENAGVEALAVDHGAMVVGSEGGDVRTLAGGRLGRERLAPEPPGGFNLTGLDALAGGDWIAVYRAWDPFRDSRIVVAHLPAPRCIRAPCVAPHGRIDLARLQRPLTVDNVEAIAAVPLAGGGWRLYLLSDDNFRRGQRTLLLAFDWKPAR